MGETALGGNREIVNVGSVRLVSIRDGWVWVNSTVFEFIQAGFSQYFQNL